MEKNPFLEPENYWNSYQKNIEDLKNRPEVIEFDKLCYELFEMNTQGKRFLEIVKERYIIPSLAKPGTATYQVDVIWGEGFKELGRTILGCIKAHKQRIEAGNN